METKKYLLDFFRYNNWANLKLLEAVKQIPQKDEALKLFSHYITALDKWMNRITKEKDDNLFKWMGDVYSLDELESKWKECINKWVEFTEKEDDLDKELIIKRPNDGKEFAIKYIDLLLQINYHFIHHRAQINTIISKQGIKPPATDYILTVLREV